MRAPRTALLLHSSAGLYGADVQLLAIVRGLDPGRWRAICVIPEDGPLRPLLEQAGAEVVVHPLAVLRRALVSVRGALDMARALRRDHRELGSLARERQVSVVHDNTSVVLAGAAIARQAGAAHVVHVREIWRSAGGMLGGVLWPLMRRRLLRADALACISEAVRSQFAGARNAVLLRDGLPAVPQAGDRRAAREQLGLPASRFVVAVVGRVSDWKGQDVLARALAEPALAEIGAICLVAGDAVAGTDAGERLDILARELGVADRLWRLGFYGDVGTVLAAADALAVPSTRPEPLGLVALEGAAAGLPVVGSAHGGLPEAIADGVTGVLVEPGSPGALAVELRALADDPPRRTRMGKSGRDLVAERFDVQRMTAGLQELWEGRLSTRSPGG